VALERRLIPADVDRELAGMRALGPPLTGASRSSMPFSFKRAATLRTTVGELVLRSNQAAPARIEERSPPSPTPTSCISFGPGREVNTTSAPRAASAIVSAHTAPASSRGLAISRLRS
jgi:hypothetical protein